VVEYYGPGVKTIPVAGRRSIGNMGTELGATSTVFPSDEMTRDYLRKEDREEDWVPLEADEGAEYDEYAEIDLSLVEPMIACPSSPGNVVAVREVQGTKVDQVIIGSSANSSFRDLMTVAGIVEGRHASDGVSFHINPGSRQVIENVAKQGGVLTFLMAGAQIHQPGCLGCIGMGQAPGTGQVSLRTMPRNFPGRSGTRDDRVYLCSPETATVSALKGVITDPRDFASEMKYPRVKEPGEFLIDDSSIIAPSEELSRTEITRGPNIKPFPKLDGMPETLCGEIVLRVGDNISTDTIMPAGNKVLPLRSNIEAISKYVFYREDPGFHEKCSNRDTVFVVGGENYGQGSSREHAALAPRYLGVRAKIVKSFARIHKANLCNFGVLPLTLVNPEDHELLRSGVRIRIDEVKAMLKNGETQIPIQVEGKTIMTALEVSDRERRNLLAGGTLNFVREQLKG
jgi:aconitate hydratase